MAASTDAPDRPLTVEEFESMPEDDSYRTELVRGRIVREPPAGFEHGWLGVNAAFYLRRFVEEHPIGYVCGADTGFVLSAEPATVRAPDAALVVHARVPPGRLPTGFFRGTPDLAIEVVSPSDRADDVQEKVLEYLEAGTRLVWVVYPGRRSVVVHEPGGTARMLLEGDTLDGGDVLPGFHLPVARLFAR